MREAVMARERAWAVHLHNDDINTIEGVVYVLHEVLGIPIESGLQAAAETDKKGDIVLGRYESQEQAERLVAQLQLYGLWASMKWT
ncbi:ATP-dependent Clp protease adaptor ClpS [Haloechinothrix salitolerans]|uniref:ATP-dependent Clp protease adaptor ClpS n=1 Tax=Haloechinothrix salitolerans TaxID=926830 RepID=A0ABW2C7D2_9PSEU